MSLRSWIEKGSTALSKEDENKAAKSHHPIFLCNQVVPSTSRRLGVRLGVVCVRGASGNGRHRGERKMMSEI